MLEFESSLMRERFVIHNMADKNAKNPVVALSNRIICLLQDNNKKNQETYVIRGHNMHICIRMLARMIQSYNIGGPFLKRSRDYDWEATWDPILNDYERKYNKDRWLAIYHEGSPVFSIGDRHPFVDMIEKLDFKHNGTYEESIDLAEAAFKKSGKDFRIEYDGNVALVINFEDNNIRNSIILRDANRTTTFSFQVSANKAKQTVNLAQCISAAAAHLEIVQLCFFVGMTIEKIKLGKIELRSDQDKQMKEAKQRLARLNTEIANMEASYNVHYRPERPSIDLMIHNAEEQASKFLK